MFLGYTPTRELASERMSADTADKEEAAVTPMMDAFTNDPTEPRTSLLLRGVLIFIFHIYISGPAVNQRIYG